MGMQTETTYAFQSIDDGASSVFIENIANDIFYISAILILFFIIMAIVYYLCKKKKVVNQILNLFFH